MSNQTPSIQISISPEQLKTLIQEAVREALLEIMGDDASSEPDFAPEIAERLRRYQQEKPVGIPIDDVVEELGIDA